jgi:hypothetical protein
LDCKAAKVSLSHLAKASIEEANLTAPAKSPSSSLEETRTAKRSISSDTDEDFRGTRGALHWGSGSVSAEIWRFSSVDRLQRWPPREGTLKQAFGNKSKRIQKSILLESEMSVSIICDNLEAALFLEARGIRFIVEMRVPLNKSISESIGLDTCGMGMANREESPTLGKIEFSWGIGLCSDP